MYRTELEALPLNTRATQRFWMLVVALLSFGAGAATMAYREDRAPVAAPAAAAHLVAPANEVWRPPVPATSSVYHGVPQRAVPAGAAGASTPGCVWTPPVPATSSVYGVDCLAPPSVPARNAP